MRELRQSIIGYRDRVKSRTHPCNGNWKGILYLVHHASIMGFDHIRQVEGLMDGMDYIQLVQATLIVYAKIHILSTRNGQAARRIEILAYIYIMDFVQATPEFLRLKN
jgi:hypothetical protein